MAVIIVSTSDRGKHLMMQLTFCEVKCIIIINPEGLHHLLSLIFKKTEETVAALFFTLLFLYLLDVGNRELNLYT